MSRTPSPKSELLVVLTALLVCTGGVVAGIPEMGASSQSTLGLATTGGNQAVTDLRLGPDFATTSDQRITLIANLEPDALEATVKSYSWIHRSVGGGNREAGSGGGKGISKSGSTNDRTCEVTGEGHDSSVISTNRSIERTLSVGCHEFTAVVTLESGKTITETVNVTVLGPGQGAGSNSAPIADTGDDRMVIANEDVTLHGEESYDRDGSIASYVWTTDGADTLSVSSATPTVQFSGLGFQNVTLTVTDDQGASDTSTVTLEVNDRPDAVATQSPDVPLIGESIEFDATGSTDAYGGIVSYEWDFDDDGTVDATGPTPTHAFTSGGNKTVTLRVTDELGVTDTTTVTFLVNDRPEAASTHAPDIPLIGDSVTFDATESSDTYGGIASYEWDFENDGIFEKSGATPSKEFTSGGEKTVTLRVTDEYGVTDTTTLTILVNDRPNPAATHSPEVPLVGKSVSFDGSGSTDTFGGIASYKWDFDNDGKTDTNGVNPSHAFASGGEKTVTLTVTDAYGVSRSTTLTFQVNDRPDAVATHSPKTPLVGGSVSLNGSGSTDTHGGIVSYEWDVDGDGTTDATGATPTRAFDSAGEKTVTLTVTDDFGVTDTATLTFLVNDRPEPAATHSPEVPLVSESVSFDATGSSDTFGGIISYEWDFDGDGITDATGATPTHVFASGGEKTITLTVTDDYGVSQLKTLTFVVNDRPDATAIHSPDTPLVGESVTFDASGSTDAHGGIVSYEWDFDGDGITDTTGVTPTHAFDSAGEKTVTLTVIDDYGVTDTTTLTFVVNDRPDSAATHSPDTPLVGESVSFDGSASTDAHGGIVSYEWDFESDGTFDATGPTPSRAYQSGGTKTVTLRVTDVYGVSSTTTVTFVANDRPEAAATHSPETPFVGETVSFDATGSTDTFGGIVSYEWDFDGDGTVDATGVTPSHAFDSAGEKTVTLWITDKYGVTDKMTLTLHVTDA